MSRRLAGGLAVATIVLLAIVLLAIFALTRDGSPPRPPESEEELQARARRDQQEMQQTLERSFGALLDRIQRRRTEDEEVTIHFLALSGGGDYGAFGAGFLAGWGEVEDSEWRRPEFDAVTGVSTGALIAPFAFVGTEASYSLVERFFSNPRDDWVRERRLFFLPSNPSLMLRTGLERDVRKAVGADLIAQIARRAESGRILGVSATDLDLGRQKFWDLGREAEAATSSGDPDRVQRILLASASVPAVFPPVRIGDSYYGDGGITENIFLRLQADDVLSLLPAWRARFPGTPVPKIRYWIVVNNRLISPPRTSPIRWNPLLHRSLAIGIRWAAQTEIRWLATQADYLNAVHGTDIEVRVVAIPESWRKPVEGDFQKETMDDLVALGRTLGADPSSWIVWAAPEAVDLTR